MTTVAPTPQAESEMIRTTERERLRALVDKNVPICVPRGEAESRSVTGTAQSRDGGTRVLASFVAAILS